jgi:hypothetical protein
MNERARAHSSAPLVRVPRDTRCQRMRRITSGQVGANRVVECSGRTMHSRTAAIRIVGGEVSRREPRSGSKDHTMSVRAFDFSCFAQNTANVYFDRARGFPAPKKSTPTSDNSDTFIRLYCTRYNYTQTRDRFVLLHGLTAPTTASDCALRNSAISERSESRSRGKDREAARIQ